MHALTARNIVAKNKKQDRERIDLRGEPDWIARITAQAERLGLNLSAYIRLAVTERLEKDESTDPNRDK